MPGRAFTLAFDTGSPAIMKLGQPDGAQGAASIMFP